MKRSTYRFMERQEELAREFLLTASEDDLVSAFHAAGIALYDLIDWACTVRPLTGRQRTRRLWRKRGRR